MRNDLARELGGYRPELPHSADFEMWLRAAAIADVGVVSGVDQAYRRLHETNMSIGYADYLSDLRERRKAFQLLFAASPPVPDREMLQALSEVALSRQAVDYAASLEIAGDSQRELARRYMEFAIEVWPKASRLRKWRRLERRVER